MWREKKLFCNADFFHAPRLSFHGNSDQAVHANLCHVADDRLVGTHIRAACRQPDHSPQRRVHRPRTAQGPGPISERLKRETPRMSANVETNVRPDYDQEIQDIADYVAQLRHRLDEAYRHGPQLPDGHARLRLLALAFPSAAKHLGPIVRAPSFQRRARARHADSPGSRESGVGHRLHDSLARLQRHLARRRVGPPLRQPRRHPGRRGLSVAARWRRARTADDARRAASHGHGARNPGRARAGQQLQPRGPVHVLLVRVASTRRRHQAHGRHREQIMAAVSQAWVDGSRCAPTATAPNAGSRKSWAAGDATPRACASPISTCAARWAYPACFTRRTWGFYDVFSQTTD